MENDYKGFKFDKENPELLSINNLFILCKSLQKEKRNSAIHMIVFRNSRKNKNNILSACVKNRRKIFAVHSNI